MTQQELQAVTVAFCDALTEVENCLKLNQSDSLALMHFIMMLDDARDEFVNAILPDATAQGQAILAEENRTCGEFQSLVLTSGNHLKQATFQIQDKSTFDMDDYHKYRTEEAVTWRKAKKKRKDLRTQASAQSVIMAAQMKAFAKANPDKKPDLQNIILKCIRKK